ncbi:hypothetical protein K2173_000785 [Erythroxylum novogranatense]|uniref:Pentatricopeptide repeat-containing protein n=1 Tax=Erythroxylum novogranatense TaxID=1862640 RepID=A0AAV8T2X2_9ROSI|nr:hypothetical protein K2173_000785 [Erythroxylum novogranatense]
MKNAKLGSVRTSTFSSTCTLTTQVLSANQLLQPNDDLRSHQNATTFSLSLQRHINSETPFRGHTIHAHILKTGFRPNTNIRIKLIILHLKCGSVKYARQVFDELRQPTLSAYNYVIGGYLKQGFVKESIALVRKLVLEGEKPDAYTFSMILKASTCGRKSILPRYLEGMVHAQIVKSDIVRDDVLFTVLVDSYLKSGQVGYARRVFDMMKDKNVICSTSMISGYMNLGSVKNAEDIFSQTLVKDVVVFNAMIEGYSKSVETAVKALKVYIDMQRFDFRPNISTFASVIGACSVLAGFEIGQQVQCQLMKTEFLTHIKLGSALVDMYSKCGRIEDARRAFDCMPEKNVFSWTSMIDGYGKNGKPIEALELFHKMKECGIKPNNVTFLGAISACGHAGLATKGREIFDSMERDYSIKPRMEHYACMVDLLGRAGSLEQAWEFVMGMPEKPNSDVWAALLSSCNLHGNVEMGRAVATELFALNAEGRPGAYVALSNTLASAGKWDGVSELREAMKLRGIQKNTGYSWVGSENSL